MIVGTKISAEQNKWMKEILKHYVEMVMWTYAVFLNNAPFKQKKNVSVFV